MSGKSTLECTKHGLRFEQIDNWHKQGGAEPKCYLCYDEKLSAVTAQLNDVTRQRDALLAAIDVKLAMPVSKERSLRHD